MRSSCWLFLCRDANVGCRCLDQHVRRAIQCRARRTSCGPWRSPAHPIEEGVGWLSTSLSPFAESRSKVAPCWEFPRRGPLIHSAAVPLRSIAGRQWRLLLAQSLKHVDSRLSALLLPRLLLRLLRLRLPALTPAPWWRCSHYVLLSDFLQPVGYHRVQLLLAATGWSYRPATCACACLAALGMPQR